MFREALPLIRDPQLAEDVRGFIGQEAMHAEVAPGGARPPAAQGLDPDPFVAQVAWIFQPGLGERPG